jgi:hypothetical protein
MKTKLDITGFVLFEGALNELNSIGRKKYKVSSAEVLSFEREFVSGLYDPGPLRPGDDGVSWNGPWVEKNREEFKAEIKKAMEEKGFSGMIRARFEESTEERYEKWYDTWNDEWLTNDRHCFKVYLAWKLRGIPIAKIP